MDRFASCYFCGEAFDASLSEYPVVPRELQSTDDGPTVVLCGTCRRKLGAVVEEVVGATQGEPAVDAATPGKRDAPTATEATNDAEAADATGSSLLDDGAEDVATTEADDSTVTAAGEWESPASDDGDESDSDGSAGAVENDSATDDGAGTVDEGTDSDDTATGDDTSGAEPTLTKLEYNKVMRLLQNRPFPVDRGEIREVATSAYDMDPQEFDTVIEAAVSRDLIGVENGQFVDPK